MNTHQIKNLEDLVHFPGAKIVNHEVTNLTSPGENFGSVMLSVDILFETGTGTKKIQAVAKTVPPNEFIQEIFNTSVTFRNEIAFYKDTIPLLQNFQKQNNMETIINFAPKYYGSRLNLSGGNNVDNDAALVLENLKVRNFSTLEQVKGLGYDVAKLVLTDLAYLHAVSLGFKLKHPKIFEKEILPYLEEWLPKIQNHNRLKSSVGLLIDEIEEMRPLKERIFDGFDKEMIPVPPREPFATITHNDCWVNNIMVKLESGVPVQTKLVDYQICSYGSPARDLVFFLFSSVKSDVVENCYQELVKWYHEKFISVLRELDCDTTVFTLEYLQREIDFEAKNSQFGHVIFMLIPIFMERKNVVDISKLSHENMLPTEFTDLHKEKFAFVVNEFLKRNWL